MKRITFYIILLVLVISFYANHNYPFIIPVSNGWSIGFTKTMNPLTKLTPDPNNIFSNDSLNNITGNTRFLADPFLLINEDKYYIFFEHQSRTGPAEISYLSSIDGLNYTYKGVALRESFHLSFPQIFNYKNDIYLLPETASANNVLLYESVGFPQEWKIKDTLIKNFKLKDPAILISKELNLIVGIDQNYNQKVFTADSLFGEWKETKDFEIGIGDEIRPAGNFFKHKNHYYIPFQNNFEGYGSGVSLYKLVFNENNRRFVKVKNLILEKNDSIDWFNRGMHHFNVTITDSSDFHIVYDGDKAVENEFTANWRASLKYNFYELIEKF